MGQEVELKLELTPEAAADVVASGVLPGAPAAHGLRSVYFDTPGRRLSSAGFSLRVRHVGDRRIQTVKASGAAAAGLFARPEWEQDVDGDRPVLDDTTPLRALLGASVHDIVPLFDVAVERLVWTVLHEGATVEVALDRGRVTAGERAAAICEIELELKQGAPAALFSLARRIAAIAPLHIGVVNKAERGFRLLGPAPGAVKAAPVVLSPEMRAGDAFRRIAGECLRQFRLNEPLIAGRNPDAVHQARVALRRLRSAFSIFAPFLGDDSFAALRAETGWLANTLGHARDLDVILAGAEAMAPPVRARLEQARDEAYDLALQELASERARALMLDLSQWLALGGWLSRAQGAELRDGPARDFASAALDRLRRKVKKGGREIDTLSDEARHEVRKSAKKLRYAAEFFISLYDDKRRRRRAKRFIAALAALQDSLGLLNDLAVAPQRLKALGIEDETGAGAKAAGRRKRELLEEAAETHDAFADAKPFWR